MPTVPSPSLPAVLDVSPLPSTGTILFPPTGESTLLPAGKSAPLWTRPLGVLLGLLATVFTVYAPSLNGQFLWDDQTLIKNNYLIRSPLFCLEVFRHTLFNDDSNFYRPTQTLAFIADYWCGGLNPFPYHLTSVLIHAANAFLLCLILRRILPFALRDTPARLDTHRLALGVSLVWAVHPIHSAAVAYTSGTADTLAMTLCLLAASLCERALDRSRPGPRAAFATGAFVCFLLGLCAKEIASVWLVLYLGYLFALRPDRSRRCRWTVVALALTALAIYVGMRHLAPPPPIPPPLPPMPAKPLLMLRALGDYGSLLLYPNQLFMERQVFAAPGLANAQDEFFYNTLAFTGVLMLGAFGAGCRWRGRGQTLRRLGTVWFLVGFLPVSNLFSLNASVAEHWLYLPSIGFLLFLAGVGLDVPTLAGGRRARASLAILTGLVVAALGVRTWYRTFDWADELTFFRQTISDGGDVPRARAGLAVAYGRQSINESDATADGKAIMVLQDMVRRRPKAAGPRINLGLALARRGNAADARVVLDSVAADLLTRETRDPREIVACLKSLGELDRDDPAWPGRQRTLLARGLQAFPHAWDLVNYGVQDCERRSQPAEALALTRRYADAHWWHAPSHYTLGLLQARLNHPADALATWREASRLDVHDATALSSAAALCLQQGQLAPARDLQERAVRRQPDSPRQHILLAEVFVRLGDLKAAQTQAARADELTKGASTDR